MQHICGIMQAFVIMDEAVLLWKRALVIGDVFAKNWAKEI
jgi:hypothetical protein